MESLYQISQDILRIFNNIETNEGEVTDEQYDALTIKQSELKTKLNNYVKAIKSWEADEKALKNEKKRFNDRQNVFKNRIERLKKAALDAVLTFGEHGKSNMFIELPTCRLFSKSSKSVEVNDARIRIFMEEFERYIRELVDADILYFADDVDLQGILDVINANCKTTQGDDFKEFTIADLCTIKINISQTASVYELFKTGNALRLYGAEPIHTKIEECTSKEDWKNRIESCDMFNDEPPTMAKVVINNSLQIR